MRDVKIEVKESAKRLIFAIVILVLLAVATFAWFIVNQVVSISPLEIETIKTSELSGTIYQKIEGEWVKIDTMKFEDMVAGEVLEYKIKITNAGLGEKTVSIGLEQITEGINNGETTMMPKLQIDNIYIVGGTGTAGTSGYFSDIIDEKNNFVLMNNIKIQGESSGEVFFNITLDGDVKNVYQSKSVDVKGITLDSI